MNIFVTGASGFIAAQIVTDLIAAGHAVTCCARNLTNLKNIFPQAKLIHCDFLKDSDEQDWLERLYGIDVLINAVGILHHPNKDVVWSIHFYTPRAIFNACVQVGVKKIIQVSALGIDQLNLAYAQSKKAADDYLLTLPIQSFVLRPSLVYGRGSYGGTSLFRGLVGLPWVIPLPGDGSQQFQPIHIQDLSKAVLHLIQLETKHSTYLNAVSEKRVSLAQFLTATRSWLGFAQAKLCRIPLCLIKLVSKCGDYFPYSVLNTTSYKMLISHNRCDDKETKRFHEFIGFKPRDFEVSAYGSPSTVQDHWHARLYFLKPLLRMGIAFIWLFTAVCSIFFSSHTYSYDLLAQMGIPHFWQAFVLYGASIMDALIGLGVLCAYQPKKMGIVQIIIICLYTFLISWKLPYLWFDPFAAIAKNIPLLLSIFVLLAMESDR